MCVRDFNSDSDFVYFFTVFFPPFSSYQVYEYISPRIRYCLSFIHCYSYTRAALTDATVFDKHTYYWYHHRELRGRAFVLHGKRAIILTRRCRFSLISRTNRFGRTVFRSTRNGLRKRFHSVRRRFTRIWYGVRHLYHSRITPCPGARITLKIASV